jgi:hypothetical protein
MSPLHEPTDPMAAHWAVSPSASNCNDYAVTKRHQLTAIVDCHGLATECPAPYGRLDEWRSGTPRTRRTASRRRRRSRQSVPQRPSLECPGLGEEGGFHPIATPNLATRALHRSPLDMILQEAVRDRQTGTVISLAQNLLAP